MKKITTTFLALLFTFSTFAQKADFINAPLNPKPRFAPLTQQLLKGDVFQLDYLNYDRDGRWIQYSAISRKDLIKLDAAGRIVEEGKEGNIDTYQYDANGNIIKKQTKYNTTTYKYDSNNRVINMMFVNDENATTITEYSYKKQGKLLIVNEREITSAKKVYETERHYDKGLQIYYKGKTSSPTIINYEFDHKGNWIKYTKIDAETKTEKIKPITREIIYYDELDRGANAFTVVAERLVKTDPLLVPRIYINNKKYNGVFRRFNDDYIFYDSILKTYYLARNGYSSANVEGKKIPIETLMAGHKVVMLYTSEHIQALIEGRSVDNSYKYITYYGNSVVRDTISGTAFSFGVRPKATDQTTRAVPGVAMNEPATSVWYLFNAERKTMLVFDCGAIVKTAGVGYTGPNNDLVMTVDNIPKYVLTNFKTVADKVITQGRYFDPKTDKIKSN